MAIRHKNTPNFKYYIHIILSINDIFKKGVSIKKMNDFQSIFLIKERDDLNRIELIKNNQ